MKILAFPANGGGNPYTTQLYSSIRGRGNDIDEFRDPWFARKQDADIVHIHWPEQLFWNSSGRLGGFRYALSLALTLWLFRIRGVPTVWTVHNLSPHDTDRGRALDLIWRSFMFVFSRTVGAWISLSQAGADAAVHMYPALSRRPSFIIPHGHYRSSYLNTISKEAARQRLKINSNSVVLLYFGNIRPYKNLEQLLSCFWKVPKDQNVRLLIAGSGAFAPAYMQIIKQMCAEDDRIQLDNRFIEADEVQVYFKAADLMVLPFKHILNSGSALLGLSFGIPVLVPDKGGMTELQRRVGADWVKVFTGELSAEQLAGVLRQLPNRLGQAPDLTDFEWPAIADRTIEAYAAALSTFKKGG